MNKSMRQVAIVLLGMSILFPFGFLRAAASKVEIKVDGLIKKVLSQDCRTRYDAVLSFIENADSAFLPVLEKELKEKSPQAADYLREAIEFVRFLDVSKEKYEGFLKGKIAESLKKAKVQENRKYTEAETLKITEEFADFFLAEIRAEKVPLNQMILVEYLAQQVTHYHPYKESQIFLVALNKLMSTQDLKLRVFAASDISQIDVKPDIRNKKVLVPILLDGLKSQEFPMRYFAQEALKRLAKVSICFDPLDPLAQRLQAVAAWQQWWKEESRKKE